MQKTFGTQYMYSHDYTILLSAKFLELREVLFLFPNVRQPDGFSLTATDTLSIWHQAINSSLQPDITTHVVARRSHTNAAVLGWSMRTAPCSPSWCWAPVFRSPTSYSSPEKVAANSSLGGAKKPKKCDPLLIITKINQRAESRYCKAQVWKSHFFGEEKTPR